MRFQPKLFRQFVFMLVAVVAAAVFLSWRGADLPSHPAGSGHVEAVPIAFQVDGPDPLEGGIAWLNTGGPIRLRDLRGKIVLLDFWTFCCINCHHVLPDLAKLEEKYKNELVVIGVHTPKFPAERETSNLRLKIREYGITHPVVNDADQVIWNRLGVSSWPTLGVFDPEGHVAFAISGEGHFNELDRVIGGLVEKYKANGKLNETPVKFFPENEKPDNTPLLFPGKVVADAPGHRLFVSDTGHNRLVMTDMNGHDPVTIGTGVSGLADGGYDKAQFNRPQGMALVGETLYVADTENHAIRAVDLKSKNVSTVAGTGEQAREITRGHIHTAALRTALNSPWDLARAADSHVLYVAMAGPHQIWKLDTGSHTVGLWAGTGAENIVDGPLSASAFAQPSGLATDGTHLFVADSEGSAVRSILFGNIRPIVTTIAGTHDLLNGQSLFAFGDVDGPGHAARLQHCLGVTFGDGKLFITDTYNNKVKVYDPEARAVSTLAGSDKSSAFDQPGGLSLAGKTLYVADTNNHRIRAIDLDSEKVTSLEIDNLSPPAPHPRKPTFPNLTRFDSPRFEVSAGDSLKLAITVPIPDGYKLNAEGSMPVVVEAPDTHGLITAEIATSGTRVDPPVRQFTVNVPLARSVAAGDTFDLKVSMMSLVCSEGSKLCTIKSYAWTVPVAVTKDGSDTIAIEGK